MNKRELIKWLDSKEQECLSAIDTASKSAIEEEKERIIERSGLKGLMEEFYKTNSEWFKKFNSIIDSDEALKAVASYSYSVLGYLKDLSSNNPEGIVEDVKSDMNARRISSIEQINHQKGVARNQVSTNYGTVVENVRMCSSAKVAIKYLKELGFDVPDGKEEVEQKFASTTVDAKYLFIANQSDSNE